MVHYAFSYSNPIVICESFFLFFGFWKLSLNSPIINWIASSTLFVYLLQVNSPIYEYLCKIDIYLLKTTSYFVYLLLTCGIIILYFVIATIYGKIIKSLLDRMLQPIKIELTKITQEFFLQFRQVISCFWKNIFIKNMNVLMITYIMFYNKEETLFDRSPLFVKLLRNTISKSLLYNPIDITTIE